MSDALSTDDIQEAKAQRDSDGELIPQTHTIDWGGEPKEVQTKPITTGLLNELSHVDEEIQRLEPGAVYEAFETIYISPDPSTFTEEDVRDLGPEYLEALVSPLEEELGGFAEGN